MDFSFTGLLMAHFVVKKPSGRKAGGDAFEDVLYGSEDEKEDSDEDGLGDRTSVSKHPAEFGIRIRVDDDEPMDLLSGAASRVTNLKNARRRRPGQEAAYFKTDEETGKMVIDESDSEGKDENEEENLAGNAYQESLTSVDGRGRNGRIKFNKDTKKRRRNEELEEDVEMEDGTAPKSKKNKQKADAPKLGHTFKAKKAAGDVKKGGTEPYAYLPLADAAKRKGRGAKMGIAGKR